MRPTSDETNIVETGRQDEFNGLHSHICKNPTYSIMCYQNENPNEEIAKNHADEPYCFRCDKCNAVKFEQPDGTFEWGTIDLDFIPFLV